MPLEVESEFHYVTGHVIELLSYCHPILLIERCKHLMASEIHKINMFTFNFLEKLKNLKTSLTVLKMLSRFWSWSNYSILECLAEFSGLAVALLEEFNSRLVLSYPIMDYPFSTLEILCDDKYYALLTIKCKDNMKVSLQLVYDIQLALTEKCDITSYALQLLAAQRYPLELRWKIPLNIVDLVNKKVHQHHQYFAYKGIDQILIRPITKDCIKHDINPEPTIFTSDKEVNLIVLNYVRVNVFIYIYMCT